MVNQKTTNVTWHNQNISTEDLAKLRGHKGQTIWFTGLSGSGKSTVANAVAAELFKRKIGAFVLDGDNVRLGLNKDIGFDFADRAENIRRIGEVANLFTNASIINCVAFISPHRVNRQIARELQPDTFLEVYCHADLYICEKRDPKGLYKKARAGEIGKFTGIDDPYEKPDNCELTIDTGTQPLEKCVNEVIKLLIERGVISF